MIRTTDTMKKATESGRRSKEQERQLERGDVKHEQEQQKIGPLSRPLCTKTPYTLTRKPESRLAGASSAPESSYLWVLGNV